VTPSLGIFWPVLVTRAIELFGALLLLLFKRAPTPSRSPRAIWPLVLSAALLDTLAFVMFNLGIGSAYTAIVTALASLFSAVTVLLAWMILRERLSASQWAGVVAILLGVLLVSV
jgi:drug/metabolite transporter (DMT)-like permease